MPTKPELEALVVALHARVIHLETQLDICARAAVDAHQRIEYLESLLFFLTPSSNAKGSN